MIPPQVISSCRRRFIASLSYSEKCQIRDGTHDLCLRIEKLKERLRTENLTDFQRMILRQELYEMQKTVSNIVGWSSR